MKPQLSRIFLLFLILIAFARLIYRLDAKNFWWDESLSLQRSESDLFALLRGDLILSDGVNQIHTTDQHPFFSFIIQGIAIRLAGNSEFVLRFPAAASATLLLPAMWVIAVLLEKKKVFPHTSAQWSTLLATISPFFLWYGQEARPYALWAMLTLVSTYLLLRASVHETVRIRLLIAYCLVLILSLTTHYLALYTLPLHALLVFAWMFLQSPRLALSSSMMLIGFGALAALYTIWMLIGPQGIGSSGPGFNFPEVVGLQIMIPDLLNAFSVGLSVNINEVWWIDLLCGGLLLLGASWAIRSKAALLNRGWLLPLMVITPVIILQIALHFLPLRAPYMNARHMSLIGGPFLLLAGCGLAVVWMRQKVLALALATPILLASGYSSYNYYFDPYYDKEKYEELGNYLYNHLLPGDIVLLDPPHAQRVYEYYLPLRQLDQAREAGAEVSYTFVPRLRQSKAETEQVLAEAQSQYRRMWFVLSGTPAEGDPASIVERWLHDHNFRLQLVRFHAYQSILDLYLFLPYPPVMGDPRIQERIQTATDIVFDEQIRLVGYSVEAPLQASMARPVTFFWGTLDAESTNYKYILQLVEVDANGESRIITATEKEPYETIVPTSIWRPEQTLIEYSELTPTHIPLSDAARYELRLQLYRVDTLEKVRVRSPDPQAIVDEVTVRLPYQPPPPYVRSTEK